MASPLKISLGFSVSFFILLVGLLLRYVIAAKISAVTKTIKDYFANAQLEKELVKRNGSVMLTTRKFTAKEIVEATSNFDPSSRTDTEKHGEVYKGILQDERVVAVKRFKSEESIVRDMFVREVCLLSRVNHRHVLRLLGYCISRRQHTLVYDFINNGTLYEHLHKKSTQGSSTLSLEIRMKIAAEIAAALAYLHSSSTSKPTIIHLNVDSKRILLDENYTARLAYFRDAKMVPEDDQTQTEGSAEGSSGYLLDPKQSTIILSEKNKDVNSFGKVLIELLTSQKEHSPEKPEEKLRDLENLFARPMDQIPDGEVIKENLETAKKVADLAKTCLGSPNESPSMKDVAMQLEALRFTAWHYSPGLANLSFSRSPNETDHLLGSPSKAQVIDVRQDQYDDFGSSTRGFISSAELFH